MASVSFYLQNKTDETTPCYIFMSFTFEGKRIRLSTGEKIAPKDWLKTEQRVSRKNKEAESINQRLISIADDYRRSYRELKNDTQPVNVSTLKRKVDKINNVIRSEFTLQGFIEHFINTRTSVSPGTIKSYKTTREVLKRFAKSKNRTVDFDSINMNFYDDFRAYLAKSLEYSDNTVGKHIKNLKVFMNEASERGIHNNMEFLKKGFKVPKEDIDNIYLTEEEISILYHLDLSKDEKLDQARDLFIVGCYTGLRFSDFTQLKRENIRNGMISLRTQKTGELVAIPVHPIIEDIIQKYKRQYASGFPPALDNYLMNRYLKTIGKMAGFTEVHTIKKTRGGKKVEDTFKKFELMTTHTARRSFATNLFLQEFPAISIMKITGHRSEKNFMNYIKMTPHQNAEKLRKHWEKVEIQRKQEELKKTNNGKILTLPKNDQN